MYRIRKVFKFEAAHQLSSAFSKACTDCIHGHSYKVEVFLVSEYLNKDDMVMDFGLLSVKLKQLAAAWDHALILPAAMAASFTRDKTKLLRKVVPFPRNPTAEMMARYLFIEIAQWLAEGPGPHDEVPCWDKDIRVERVRVHETETGFAEYEEDGER